MQIAVNQDLYGADSVCEKQHWVLQDANYNVMGLVDSDGDLVERYEYSPYGERKVFVSAGTNDPGCYAPTLLSRRVKDSYASLDQPFGLCEFGHQGLPHEEEIDNGRLIQNRRRVRLSDMWCQRDPWQKNRSRPTAGDGYQDGMNLYQYVQNNPNRLVDLLGLAAESRPDLPCVKDGQNIVFVFNGGTLAGSGKSWSAYSGRPVGRTVRETNTLGGQYVTDVYKFSYDKTYSKKKNVGPIPEGKYWLSVCDERNPENRMRHKYATAAWGSYSWPLTPYPQTDVTSDSGETRTNFNLHGGKVPGSAGCIDLVGNDFEFHVFSDDVKKECDCCYIDVVVEYKYYINTATQYRYQPWIGLGSESSWQGGGD